MWCHHFGGTFPDVSTDKVCLRDFLRCHSVRADLVGELCRKVLADEGFPWAAHRGSRNKQWLYVVYTYSQPEATAYRDLIRGFEKL